MNVLLHKEIFNGSVSQTDVSYLIQTIIRKKHSILLDADDMKDITWLNDSDRMIIEDSFAAASIGDPVIPDCEVIHNAANIHHAKQFDVAEAIRYVDTPLEIILENGTNDLFHLVIRGFSAGAMHIACAFMIGYGLRLLKRSSLIKAAGLFGLLCVCITFHAIFNMLMKTDGVLRQIGYAIPITVIGAQIALKHHLKKYL